jgi:cytochrome c oxidase subunit 2
MSFVLPQATAEAAEVDHLILALTLVSCAVLLLVYGLMWLYMIKYRAGSALDRGAPMQKTWRLEIAWTTATLMIFFGLFLWGADLYVRLFQAPANALRVYVVGKQWLWKIEHEGGQREINALHLPISRPIQLVMTSEDVIHDFSLPAFRIKHDVLPGRYETLWFTVEKPGVYRLFCTQFCGAEHASMVGEVVAMTEPAFEKWLGENRGGATMAAGGRSLYASFGCGQCHGADGGGGTQIGSAAPAPALKNLYGRSVALQDGGFVTADERYLRDAIVAPSTWRVAGYPPLMPSFQGQIDEDNLLKIVAYIKSLGEETQP